MKKSLYFVYLAFALAACNSSALFPVEPKITYLDIQARQVKEYQDSMIITFSFTDGDGDLGQNTAGYENLFLKDSRTGGSYTYRIRELVPDNAKVPVKGTLKFVLPFTFLSSESVNSEQVVFEIKIKD
jgi:hypothetical protein